MPIEGDGNSSSVRVANRESVLGLLTDASAEDVAAAATRVSAMYRSVPGLEGWTASTAYVPERRAGVVVVGDNPPALHAPFTLVWGCAVGCDGLATEAEISAAVAEPDDDAHGLDGVFVLLDVRHDRIRAVTSSAFAFTLRQSGSAFATRGAAALSLAGRPLRVDRERAVEAVAWQAVLRAGEVLADVTALEEATVVDVDIHGSRQRSYRTLAERLAPAAEPTVHGFRAQLTADMQRYVRVPRSRLALTGGRDSILAASCLAAADGTVPTMTMGYAQYGDVRAAAAVAHELGWSHDHAPVLNARGHDVRRWPMSLAVPGSNVLDWLVRYAPWGEGLQHPRDALVGHLRWPHPPFVAITGHSGEVGRGFYWSNEPDREPVELMTSDGPGGHLPAAARAAFGAVLEDDVRLARDIGRADAALDVIYARRQRSWLPHTGLPSTPLADLVPVFLRGDIVRALLDVPKLQRRHGRFFDDALHAELPHLRQSAVATTPSRYWRLLGPMNPYRLQSDWPLLRRALADIDDQGGIVREVIGDDWWRWAVSSAEHQPWVRGPLWNAVAVEALHRWS